MTVFVRMPFLVLKIGKIVPFSLNCGNEMTCVKSLLTLCADKGETAKHI